MRVKLNVVETYRIDTESEVEQFITDVKDEALTKGYELASYSSTKKEKKSKGAVVDEGFEVKVNKKFNSFWTDGAF